MKTDYAIAIPRGLSFLATHDINAKVAGLEEFPRDQWPNIRVVHWSFDIMVGSAMAMLALAAWSGWLWWKHRRLPDHKGLLRALVAAGSSCLERGELQRLLGIRGKRNEPG